MKQISRAELKEYTSAARIKPRLVRELRFVPEDVTLWGQRDFLAVLTKSKNEGVLPYEDRVVPFRIEKRKSGVSGRIEPIICDICSTWQRGSNSANITFARSDKSTVSYLCCADLDCSSHVRGLTNAGRLARTQLREDITPKRRIERLHTKITAILANLV